MSNVIYWGDGEGSICTEEGKRRLWEDHNIVYVGGVYAAKIIQRKNSEPLIELIAEDDCALFTDNHSLRCSAFWIPSLKELLDAVNEKIAKLKKKEE